MAEVAQASLRYFMDVWSLFFNKSWVSKKEKSFQMFSSTSPDIQVFIILT